MDSSRVAYWQKRLRPIRIGAEPIDAQVSRRFLGMVVVTALTVFIAMFMLAIFAGFGRADIGLRLVALIFLPATLWFWLDYAVLRHRASAYIREMTDDPPPG